MKKYILIFSLLFSSNVFADAPQAILWNSLAPGPAKLPAEVNINQALNGKQVVIPGFVIPLDTLEGQTRDFLLSPRQGACIHRPPPGPNQLIHVTFEQPIALPEIEQPIYISGTLAVRSEKNAFAQTGYFIQGDEAIPYPVKIAPSASNHSH
ncbi:DUF3299 domain-containing protein [Shewanella sp. Isolate7]|uniref:DUF3299 domain-containing protein n=1 Tax=Shewanella sp. Isolate7 TaxID=2908528 RepID=UPI001EFEBB32|nr:DUF3299 domain-containing protein [Shewanella sp. Isolate7]MCG9720912.1 DUF3299 domain-containing protein [Shewanella sp. Isolate7]